MSDMTLHYLPPSPNSMKVRIALNYKGIPYEGVPIELDDEERKGLVSVSGQPLAPVLVHGDRVILDSQGIVRYLEANFRDTPRLMFTDRQNAIALERMESSLRAAVSAPVGMIFEQAFAPEPDMDVCASASQMMNTATADIEAALENSEFLMGDSMKLPDIAAAPFVSYAMVPAEHAASHPIVQFFHDNLHLGEGRDRTRAWVGRLMAHNA